MTKRPALGIVAGMGTTKTRPYECDEDRLQDDVRELKEELRVLRIAIDELRDDVVWAARQVLDAGHRVAGDLMPKRAPDPLAPDSNGHGPDPFPTTAPPPADPVPREDTIPPPESVAPSPPAIAVANTLPQEKPQPITPPATPSPSRTTSRWKHLPLYMRVYQDRLLTDLVRAVGYETLSGEEILLRLKPHSEKYSQEEIALAMQDVLTRFSLGTTDYWHLTVNARNAARALLGPPPDVAGNSTIPSGNSSSLKEAAEARMTASSNSSSDEENNATVEVANQVVKLARKTVLARFWEHLNDEEEVTFEIPTDIQNLLRDQGRMLPDVALGEPPYELIAVRRTLSAAQRHDMAKWLEVSEFGNRATRAWPRKNPGGWWWEYEIIASRREDTTQEISTTD